jgi:hypothetical protein
MTKDAVAARASLSSLNHILITTQICASAKSIQIDHNHIIVAYECSDLRLCSEKLLLLLRLYGQVHRELLLACFVTGVLGFVE